MKQRDVSFIKYFETFAIYKFSAKQQISFQKNKSPYKTFVLSEINGAAYTTHVELKGNFRLILKSRIPNLTILLLAVVTTLQWNIPSHNGEKNKFHKIFLNTWN